MTEITNIIYNDARRRISPIMKHRYDRATLGATLNRVVQRVWRPLYIDALIAMQTDVDSDAT